MKILLTGGTGFVGMHTAQALRAEGHEVWALVRNSSKAQLLHQIGVRLIEGALDKPDTLASLPKVDSVLHIAGIIKVKKLIEFHKVNVEGTENLIKALSNQKLKRFVLVSSVAARGPNHLQKPVSAYGRSKLAGEEVAKRLLPHSILTIIRPPIVYGPGDRETLSFFKMFKLGFITSVMGTNQRMSFIYVKDLAQTLVEAATRPHASQIPFEVDDGHGGYTWDEVAEIACCVFQKPIRLIPLPKALVYGVCAISDAACKLLDKAPMVSIDKYEEMTQPAWTCDAQAVRALLPHEMQTDLAKGFRETMAWYRRAKWI